MSTTINTYSVGLTLNASDYIKNSVLTRKETGQLTNLLNQSRIPAENAARSITLLEKALQKGAISQQTFNTLVDRQNEKLRNLNSTASASVGAFSKFSNVIAAVGVTQFIRSSVNLQIELEQAAAKFEVLTGSVKNAEIMLADLRTLAASSPITLSGAQDAASTLLQFGVAGSNVIPTLNMLNDIAGGNEERFKSLALAFGQSSAAGRLMGQDLLQMVAAGFNPLQEISRKTGETMIELKKRMEDGGISAQEVAEAFKSATGEGGRYNGMADKLAETMGGKLAVATSQLQEAMTKLGEIISPLIIDLVEGFEQGKSALDSMLVPMQGLVDLGRYLLAIMKDVGNVFERIMDANDPGATTLSELFPNLQKFDQEYNERMRMSYVLKPEKRIGEIVDEQNGAVAKQESLIDKMKGMWTNFADVAGYAIEGVSDHIDELQQAQDRLASDALSAAAKKFEDEIRIQEQIAKDIVSKMGGAGMSATSAEYVAFRANQRNTALASRMSQPQAQPTDEQLLSEARRQLIELQKQSTSQKNMQQTLVDILRATEENPVVKVR